MVIEGKGFLPKGVHEQELGEWLRGVPSQMVDYFDALLELYAVLVRGRNKRTTPTLQQRLPYELVLAIMTDGSLRRSDHLNVCERAASLMRDLYVDNDIWQLAPSGRNNVRLAPRVLESHEEYALVKTVRVWEFVPDVANAGVLSSTHQQSGKMEWGRFDQLKDFIATHYAGKVMYQVATEIKKNKMLREVIRLIYELIRHGFYATEELAPMIPSMLILLDGRGDRIRPTDQPSKDRYQKQVMIDCDTVVIMECKLWILRMLQVTLVYADQTVA